MKGTAKEYRKTSISLPKAYEPKTFEEKWYSYWMGRELFKAHASPGKPKFSIVIPPPNITGALHMGHALDTTLQDIFVRYNRMQGNETLWLPGSDHASIATHAKIEEMLAEEGTSRWELGREKFLERAWEWKAKYGHIITDQLKKIGASCDWSRERFTMDEGCSRAVNEVFLRLYEKGLIYRGKYMVNFCPGCRTVISDIEVEHEDTEGHLYYIRYPVLDLGQAGPGNHPGRFASEYSDFVAVATTRPETMLGDTAIAVNPDDPRYGRLVGRYAVLPLVGRILPIIADEHVDPEFGTGAVKVTPAHDPNDFDMGLKHDLEFISVIDIEGKMTKEAGKYQSLDRYQCRKKVLADLETQGYLIKTEALKHSVGHCHRCHSAVEPLISEQWFVKMKPLARPALEAVKDGQVTFVPERFRKIYEHWMENIRDWCISRQLWWGHRIPAWYCSHCSEIIVATSAPDKCPKCGGSVWQDEDVLDTWFSSALWPFSTMGWPENTPDLEYFFPTDILITGYDIIFFWVARMIFSSLEFMGQVPFHHVLIHGLVRDSLGRKMSKSLGNGVDPLEVIEKYGGDALRISLISGVAMGSDMRFFDEKVEGARNFCNKLWNAARYCLANLEGWQPSGTASTQTSSQASSLTSRWILSRLGRTAAAVEDAMNRYEPGEALDTIIDFVWNQFCDWYIEFSKEDLANPETATEAKFVLYQVLKTSLALLHPFAPFITEELWSYLPTNSTNEPNSSNLSRNTCQPNNLIIATYPVPGMFALDADAEEQVDNLIEVIKGIRNMRAEVNIPTGKREKAILLVDDRPAWENLASYIKRLAWTEPLEILSKKGAARSGEPQEYKETTKSETLKESWERPRHALASVAIGAEMFLPLAGVIDIDKEIARLEKAVGELKQDLERTEERLSNHEFLAKAPEDIVEKQRKRHQDNNEKLETLKKRLEMLCQARL
ncbi:MAG: valine--tRNA ligase [Bacillota bacterium]|jgi:valyl-tRNA synthetase